MCLFSFVSIVQICDPQIGLLMFSVINPILFYIL